MWSFDGNLYSDPLEQQIATTCFAPSEQASSLEFKSIGTSHITLSWHRGTGEGILVLASENRSITSHPVSGVSYRADNQYGAGDAINGNVYAVYNGQGDSVRVDGLEENKNYYFNLYEYQVADSCYLATPLQGVTNTIASGLSGQSREGFKIYPNPARSRINIENTNGISGFQCILYDYTGRKVFSRQYGMVSRATIPLDDMEPGIYLVEIRTSGARWYHKIIRH